RTIFQGNSDEKREEAVRKTFQEELDDLHTNFYKMGQQVHEAVHRSVHAFISQDIEMAEKVIKKDTEINQMEEALEHACIELIALQQPVSMDLRKIITIMKASADLEPMGDHAVSISKATLQLIGEESFGKMEEQISSI